MKNKCIKQLIDFCIDQTSKGNHFFFDYSAHINTFSIRGYSGEWALHKESLNGYCFNVSELNKQKVDACISNFKSLLDD